MGLGLASTGVLEPFEPALSSDPAVAAEVNGAIITRDAYERASSALAAGLRDPLSKADEQHVLDRLIEEELLLARAMELGLDRSNPVVRNALISAMIEVVVEGVSQSEPDLASVEAFYAENRPFFARSTRYWVRQLRFPFDEKLPDRARTKDSVDALTAQGAATEATRRLRSGEPLAVVARELWNASIVALPDGYLPAAKLREYLGTTPAERALDMQTGEVSDPIETPAAWHVLQMVERIESPMLPLSAVETQVRAEMRRRAGDQSLRAYLALLREGARIRIPEG